MWYYRLVPALPFEKKVLGGLSLNKTDWVPSPSGAIDFGKFSYMVESKVEPDLPNKPIELMPKEQESETVETKKKRGRRSFDETGFNPAKE